MRADIHWDLRDDINVYEHLYADGSYACAYLTLHTGPSEHDLSDSDGRLVVSSMDAATIRRVAAGLEQLAADLDTYHAGHAAAAAARADAEVLT